MNSKAIADQIFESQVRLEKARTILHILQEYFEPEEPQVPEIICDWAKMATLANVVGDYLFELAKVLTAAEAEVEKA